MTKVRAILDHLKQPLARIDPDATVLDAARLMNERRIGALVVSRGDRLAGIITERDVLNRVVAAQRDPSTTRVQEVMTSSVTCCSPETTRSECEAIMRRRKIRHLPVVEGERVVGMVSVHDVLEDEAHEQAQTIRNLFEYMHGEWRSA
ncbi:MAG: CBS domain-containing protein [Phycisphaerae bacterium]|jgi:CBS domain-containing protein